MPALRPCALSSSVAADALRHVFLGSAAAQPASFLLPALRLPVTLAAHQRRTAKRRATDDTEALLAAAAAASSASATAAARGPRNLLRWAHPDRDEGIASPFVVVVDPASNDLSRPRALQDVLRSIDRKESFVVRVGGAAPRQAAAPSPDDEAPDLEEEEAGRPRVRPGAARRDGTDALNASVPDGDRRFAQARPGERSWPVVKIMARKEVFAKDHSREKNERKQAAKAKRKDGKTVELGWNMADGDLAHRMRKARELVQEGGRVNIVVDKKRKRDVIEPTVAQALLDKAVAALMELPGVKEARREGKLGENMKVVFDKA